ncbi:MAG TPA: class D sortase [Gemmatimonadaceae bacterium]
MHRRAALGLSLVLAGVALAGWAGAAYGRGWLAQSHARAEWEAKLAHAAVERARNYGASSTASLAEGAPVARLLVPKISLDDIVLEGVTAEVLNGGPGHLPGSALPGDEGNAVVSAHRDRHFRRLGELALGDTVVTETEAGRTSWRVVGRKVVHKDAPVIRRESGRVLTLTTCWPIGYLGGAPERLILRAVPLDAQSVAARY